MTGMHRRAETAAAEPAFAYKGETVIREFAPESVVEIGPPLEEILPLDGPESPEDGDAYEARDGWRNPLSLEPRPE
ncbi:hypothetical protein [Salininema proteolyticum]|uniref:Uncharacterized protein n=1 Tax=Salininema proteolyticum TaxID=1607685 RepID=A0ABV8TXZ4_9ACTN